MNNPPGKHEIIKKTTAQSATFDTNELETNIFKNRKFKIS